MFRIDTPNAAGSLPAPAPVGTQGYFSDSTPGSVTELSADWCNAVMEEIAAVVEAAGLTLDKADSGQMADALAGAYTIASPASDHVAGTSVDLRAMVACQACSVSELNVLAGSKNAAYRGNLGLAVGWSASALSAGDLADSNNHNLVFIADALGVCHVANTLKVGGSVDAGTGAKFTVAGLSGDLAIATNKFTVDGGTGNTVTAGTLSSTGDFKVATTKFTVEASSGNTVAAGTLSATGDFKVNTTKLVVTASSGDLTSAGAIEAATTVTAPLGLEVSSGAGTGVCGRYTIAALNAGTTDSTNVVSTGLSSTDIGFATIEAVTGAGALCVPTKVSVNTGSIDIDTTNISVANATNVDVAWFVVHVS